MASSPARSPSLLPPPASSEAGWTSDPLDHAAGLRASARLGLVIAAALLLWLAGADRRTRPLAACLLILAGAANLRCPFTFVLGGAAALLVPSPFCAMLVVALWLAALAAQHQRRARSLWARQVESTIERWLPAKPLRESFVQLEEQLRPLPARTAEGLGSLFAPAAARGGLRAAPPDSDLVALAQPLPASAPLHR